MAYTQEQLDAMDEAIASNVTSIKVGEQQVNFGNMDSLLKARDRVARALAAQSGEDDDRPMCGFASFSRE